jgi:hypothetical protein
MMFGRKEGANDDWESLFAARLAAMEGVLGKPEEDIFHAPVPLHMDGSADVLVFRNYVDGVAYVTSGLIGSSDQKKNRLGNYELMICTRNDCDWAPGLIGNLGRYTFDAKLNPGETMDIGPALPPGSNISALWFTEPDPPCQTFEVLGIRSGILLCVGITSDELGVCRSKGPGQLSAQLKVAGVFPFTDLNRTSTSPLGR